MSNNIEEIVTESVEDAEMPQDETLEVSEEPTTTADDIVAPEASEGSSEGVVEDSGATEVENPAVKADSAQDDFEKKFGIPAQSSSGRENRIPYSRVKKIVEKAVKDAKPSWEKDLEASHVPVTKFQELDTKVKDYEGRLTQVAEFERIMSEEPVNFLKMLVKLPQYAQIFNPASQPQGTTPNQPNTSAADEMPQPDQQMPDGSMVYSMDGLKNLLEWRDQRVEARVTKQIEDRYAPLENDYKQYQSVQAVIPQVQKQIDDARRLPLFNENEDEIVKALQANPAITLDQAYLQVVLPKFKVDRDKMRAELLKEVKQAPKATSVSSGATKPAPVASTGSKSLEAIIEEAIQGIK